MKSVDRCYNLDESLSKLARIYPDTKFLRSRAAALGFTSTSTPTRSHVLNRSRNIRQRSCRNADDADDPYEDGKYDESGDLLAYHSAVVGSLVHSLLDQDSE